MAWIKRVISLILCFALVAGYIPAPVSAEEVSPQVQEEAAEPVTEAAEEPATEETAAEETEAPVTEETEPVTEATEEPVTEETTEPATSAATEPVEEETQPVCTGLADCAAEEHTEDCEKLAAEKAAADQAAADEVAALIAEMPSLEAIQEKSLTDQQADYSQVQDAYEAYCALTSDQQTLLPPAEEVFKPYFDYFNAQTEAAADHSHPICGSSCGCASDAHTSYTWTAWDGTTKLMNGNYYLAQDLVLDNTMILDYSYSTKLCLNGHSITCTDTVFDIYSYRSLLISDCVGTGKVESAAADCTIGNNKFLSIWGGTIRNTSAGGSAIDAYAGTTTYVCGGLVEGNAISTIYMYPGSDVRIQDGTVHNIRDCYAISGLCQSGTHTLSNLTVSGGNLTTEGSKLVVEVPCGNFTMSGGYIDGDVIVYSEEGTTTVSGGTIDGMLDVGSQTASITGGDMCLHLSGTGKAEIHAGKFRDYCIFWTPEVTVTGGDFSAAEGVVINGKTWICGGSFSNVSASMGSLYLSGVPTIDTLQVYKPSLVSAQSEDGTGSYGGDPIAVWLNNPYESVNWTNGTTIIRNVTSDAVAQKFQLKETDEPWMSLKRSGNNLILKVLPHGTCGANLKWMFDQDTGTLTISGSGEMTDYTSNSSIPWEDYWDKIKNIVMEDTATSIGNYAFAGLNYLESVTLSKNLTRIGNYAFSNAGTSLNTPSIEITVPASVTSMDSYAFANAQGIAKVTLAEGITTVGYGSFMQCTGLTEVVFPASITKISDYAFENARNITSITFRGEAPTFGSMVFRNITAQVTYPANDATWTADVKQNYGGTLTWGCESCKDGHTEVVDEAVAATCATDGLTEGSHCSVCGEVIVAQEVIPAGHTVVDDICTICNAYGTCGENLTWSLDDSGVLTIRGTGPMEEYADGYVDGKTSPPWSQRDRNAIKHVLVESGVTTISDAAFCGLGKMKTVSIAETVESIGGIAFEYCGTLEELVIPDRVAAIGVSAFLDCTQLKTVTIGTGLTSIGGYAFGNCESLQTITFHGDAPSISNNVFSGTSATAYYPASNATWTADVKQNYGGTLTWVCEACKAGHTEVTDEAVAATCITEGLTEGSHCDVCGEILMAQTVVPSAGKHSFVGSSCEYCGVVGGVCGEAAIWTFDGDTKTLTISGTGAITSKPWQNGYSTAYSLIIEDGITQLFSHAFENMPKLSSVRLPSGLTEIPGYCFVSAESLTSINIPDSVTTIGEWAFGDTGFSTFTIPDSVTSEVHKVVSGSNLKEIYIGAGAQISEKNWSQFGAQHNLQSYIVSADNPYYTSQDGVLYTKDMKTLVNYPGGKAGAFSIPEGVETINSYAFEESPKITEIYIPASVKVITENQFGSLQLWNTSSLENIHVDENNTAFSSKDGVLYNKDKTILFCCGPAKEGAVSVAESTWEIGSYAFQRCSKLTNVALPDSLEHIGMGAFRKCSSLQNIVIPASITGWRQFAFQECTSLAWIACGVKNGSFYQDFDKCYSLRDVYYYGTEAEWNTNTISSYDAYVKSAAKHYNSVLPGTWSVAYDLNGGTNHADNPSVYYNYGDDVTLCDPVKEGYTFEGWYLDDQLTEEASAPQLTRGYSSGEKVFYAKWSVDSQTHVHQFDANNQCGCGIYGGICGDDLTWMLDASGTLTISGTGDMYDYRYDEDDGEWIKTPGWLNFDITKVIIDSGITSIGGYAFYDMPIAEPVTLPDTVTEVRYNAFQGTNATIVNSRNLTVIGEYGMAGTKVDKLYQPVTVGAHAFQYTEFADGNVVVTGDVKNYAFFNSNITSITLTEDVTYLREGSLSGCGSLTAIYFCCDKPDISGNTFDMDGVVGVTHKYYRSSKATGFSESTAIWDDAEHAYVKGTVVAPTCTEKGYTIYSCPYCSFTRKGDLVPAGHTVVDGICTGCQNYGECGTGIYWKRDENYTMTFYGTGVIESGSSSGNPPFDLLVHNIVISEGITDIGTGLFGYLGRAYLGDGLQSVNIASTVTAIGANAFANCGNVSSINFNGDAPTIDANAFAGLTAIASYPDGNDTWTEVVKETYGGNITWVAIGSDSSEPAEPTEPTESTEPVELYTLTFHYRDADGNWTSSVTTVEPGDKIYAPAIPEISGILHTGWDNDLQDGYTKYYVGMPTEYTATYVEITDDGLVDLTVYAYYYVDGVYQNKTKLFVETFEKPGSNLVPWLYSDGISAVQTALAKVYGADGYLWDPAVFYNSNGDGEISKDGKLIADGNKAVYVKIEPAKATEANVLLYIHTAQEAAIARTILMDGYTAGDFVSYNDALEKARGFYTSDNMTMSDLYDAASWKELMNGQQVSGSKTIKVKDNGTTEIHVVLTNAYIAGTVKQKLNVRSEPSTTGAIVKALEAGTKVEILEIQTVMGVDWGLIADGWILMAYVDLGDGSGNDDNICGDNLTWSFDKKGGTLTISGTGDMYDYEQNKTPWEQYCGQIRSVVVENGVTSVGNFAFFDCTALETVQISATVKAIGEGAFVGSNCLRTITVNGKNPNFMDEKGVLFNKDKTLLIQYPCQKTDVYYRVPDSVTEIRRDAFYNCDNLSSVNLPDGLEIIGYWAFYDCDGLKEIRIPDSVTELGMTVFSNCTSLQKVVIGSGVKDLDSYVFENCTSLTEVQLPDTLVNIWENAFAGCTSLQSIHLPAGMNNIADGAFHDCTALEEIIIGGVQEIYWPFENCTALKNVYFRGDAPIYCTDALQTLTLTAYYPADNATWTSDVMASFGGNITWIPVATAGDCGDSVTWSYDTNTNTLTISGTGDMADYPDSAPWAAYSKEIVNLVIENGVTGIGDYAFKDCEALYNASFPGSLTRIGEAAFPEFERILPDGSTEIYGQVFWSQIDQTVRQWSTVQMEAGNNGFPYWDNTTFRNDAPIVASGVFGPTMYWELDQDGTATIFGTGESYEFWATGSHLVSQPVKHIVMEEGITGINLNAFEGVTTVESVTVASTVKTVETMVFADCQSLNTITFLGDAPTFGADCFRNVTATAIYPANNATWTAAVMQDYEGNILWIPSGAVKNRVTVPLAELNGETVVWIDGREYAVQIDGDMAYVDLPDSRAKTMVVHTYHVGDVADVHTQYPIGMKVWMLENTSGYYTVTRADAFDDILQYSGMSIRVFGQKGIRMITAMEQATKNALTTGGMEGYTLKEYGTVIAWDSQVSATRPLVLDASYVRYNYAYKEGIADPVFKYVGDLMQYTNVLVNFTNDQCKDDLAMRPYMILEHENGEQIILYGGIVRRSIGYIAYQNRNVFEPGTDAYEYVWEIIRYVYGTKYDEDYIVAWSPPAM